MGRVRRGRAVDDWKRVEDNMVAKGVQRLKKNPQWQYDDHTWRVIHATEWSTMPRDADSYGLEPEDVRAAFYDATLNRIKSSDSEKAREAFRKNYREVADRGDPEEMVKHLDACDLYLAMREKNRPKEIPDNKPLTYEQMRRLVEG